MKQIIIVISVILWWITLSCSYSSVILGIDDRFNLRQFVFYDNIIEFAIVDTTLVEGRKLFLVEPITYIKYTGKLFTHYIPEYPLRNEILGDTMVLFYKKGAVQTYDRADTEQFNFYVYSPCGDITIYKKAGISRPKASNFDKLKNHFRKMTTSQEDKGFIYYHDDGSKWLEGQFKNGKPSGTWIEYYSKRYGKGLIATRVNFETGLVLVQFYREHGNIKAIHYRMALLE